MNEASVNENMKVKESKEKSAADNNEGENRHRTIRKSIVDFPRLPAARRLKRGSVRESVWDLRKNEEVRLAANEERLIFIEALRSAYHFLVEKDEIESRGFLPYAPFRSLDYAQDKAARGQPLADWEALCVSSSSLASHVKIIVIRLRRLLRLRTMKLDKLYDEIEHFGMSFLVQEILVFIKAHEIAKKAFKDLSQGDGEDELTRAENMVLQESDDQVLQAEQALNEFDSNEVKKIKSHYACHIILSTAAAYYERLSRQGLVTGREASTVLEEIEAHILHTNECQNSMHAGELSERHKLKMMPDDDLLSPFNMESENTEEEV